MAIAIPVDEVPRGLREMKGGENYTDGSSGTFVFEHTDFFGAESNAGRGPQCFRVDIPKEGFVIRPHFHFVDQFQVAIRGQAMLGKDDFRPVTVHYTDSFTPYGPFNLGPEGVAWVTFRTQADSGAQTMPESREKMARKAGRHFTIALEDAVDTTKSGPMRIEALVDPHDDGLGAYVITAGPGSNVVEPAGGGSGRYSLVIDGAVEQDGKTLGRHSIIFSRPGSATSYRTGPQGARVVALQLPTA
jgi:hypothetical protein